MKSTARISIVAVCLCASSLLAQDESLLRARGFRPQRSPSNSLTAGSINSSAGPVSRPQLEPPPRSQFRPPSQTMQGGPLPQNATPFPTPTPLRRKYQRARQTAHRADEVAPNRSGSSAEIGNPKTNSTTGNSPVRHKSKKQQKETSRSANKSMPAQSPPASEHPKAERPVVAPVQTPVIPPTIPARTIEKESIVPPAGPPPVAIAPSERSSQIQAQPQPSQSHLQRAILNDLSEEERSRLHSAHQNALQRDPNLAASRARYLNARKEFREKLRDALLKTDPSVRPILDKIHREQNDDR